jgi:predicted permease
MKWTRWLARRARLLFRKEEVERELDEEVRHHVALEARELERQGMPRREALREARLRFGGTERYKERVREARGGRLLEDLLRDLRHGIRTLGRSPGFTASALLVLALGIGASTALFGVVRGVLLRPLPYPEPDRLVRVWPASPTRGIDRAAFSFRDFEDWRAESSAVEAMGLWSTLPGDYPLIGESGPEEIATVWVGGDFFGTLGVPAALGRTLRPDDVEAGRTAVVLSHDLWERRFGGDPGVVGRTIPLDHRPFEVVGVMPEGFAFPDADGELWTPITVIPEDDIPIHLRQVRFAQGMARLASGVTVATAARALSALAGDLEARHPDTNAGVSSATVVPLRAQVVGEVETALWTLLGAVGFVLLLVCANVANLLLARGTTRAREMAIRRSLGASSGRVTRQLLTESLLLGVAGGALGLVLARLGTDLLVARSAGLLPRTGEVALDGAVLAVGVAVTLGATLLAGVVPALRTARATPGSKLREGGRGVAGGTRGVRLRRGLVAAEVALAVVLLVGAGLLFRSVRAMGEVDPGFETGGRLAMTLTISDQKHPDRGEWMSMYREILRRMEALPGVEAAGAIRYLPFRGEGEAWPLQVPGLYEPTPEEQRYVRSYQVSPDLFQALGIRVLRGRGIRPTDGPDDPFAIVVNETLAREFFQGRNPVGRRVRVAGTEIEVLGVVEDVRHAGLAEEAPPVAYVPQEQSPRIQMSYVLSAGAGTDPLGLADDLRDIVHDLDPEQAINEILPLEELAGSQTARPRFVALLLGLFATLAVLLAALGVYGVLSWVVRARTREMGLRMALGASAGQVRRMVLANGLRPVGWGLLLGLAAALVLTRFLESLLFGVPATDPATYLAVAAGLGVVGVAASLVPAWSATRVDPMESLRAE